MLSLGTNVKDKHSLLLIHAEAQPSRLSGDCKVLLYSSRPSSPQVSFVGGLGFAVAEAHGEDPDDVVIVEDGVRDAKLEFWAAKLEDVEKLLAG